MRRLSIPLHKTGFCFHFPFPGQHYPEARAGIFAELPEYLLNPGAVSAVILLLLSRFSFSLFVEYLYPYQVYFYFSQSSFNLSSAFG